MYKKSTKYIALVSLLLVGMVMGVIATAQTPDSPSVDSSTPQNDSGGTSMHQGFFYWRHRSSDLQQKIAALDASPVPTFPIPVLFGVGLGDISPNFGAPRATRLHEGEDIMATKGTPIVSPTPAVVIMTDYGAGEGNAVYTANPGGETYVYYHLDRVGEGVVAGQVLAKGSLIGYVGNTGDAAGGAAHLHFEVRSSTGVATDPFPRLKAEFSLPEKITYLSDILAKVTDTTTLSQFLVTYFRITFTAAQTAGIALPISITDALVSIPPNYVPPVASPTLPFGDLNEGSSGLAVTTLQKYLIQVDSGPAAKQLAAHGATTYFGALTKAALIEFQAAVGISPVTGYYGPKTRSYIESHPLTPLPAPNPIPTPIPAPTPTPPPASIELQRNLYYGIGGEDVRLLQKFLNAHGYTISLTGNGSPGNEIPYFGPGTQAAVIKFQLANNISPAIGYVGPITRAAINSF